ncbi:TIGR03749 family integrating conjugative element protein [Legionella sp. CNM-1927-20]|uniref:TIGR03749 family integrating conjugative element protein n=1 Tax=Legionella sp. CNM-1927-20 TaxID=3422221 RepID=UPI00403AF875
MNQFKTLLTLILCTISLNAFSFEAEHVLWDKTPIPVTLSLNEERLIHFAQPISIIDNEAADKIAILKVQDSLYIKAKEPFVNQRLLVQLMPQGEVIILTLSTTDSVNATKPIDILLESYKAEQASAANTTDFDFNAITLTRFAIQSLYAPLRLLTMPEGINRVPMQTRRFVNLVYEASVDARPLISWQAESLYVTAIELKNGLKREVILDPRRLLGHWQTVTFYPTNILAPRGKNDSTTAFLISERPFSDALEGKPEFVR